MYPQDGIPPVLQKRAGMQLTFMKAWLSNLQAQIHDGTLRKEASRSESIVAIGSNLGSLNESLQIPTSKIGSWFSRVFRKKQGKVLSDLFCVASDKEEVHKQEHKILIQVSKMLVFLTDVKRR